MSGQTIDDVQWLREVVRRYERPLVAYAYKLLGDLDLARDVVQDTFLRLCDQRREKIEHYLAEWLFTVCRNRATDVRRKEGRKRSLSDSMLSFRKANAPAPSQRMEKQESVSNMLRELDRLPANQQEVLRLKFKHGMSYKQISRITGLTVSYVGWLIHTGLKNLRSRLDQKEEAAG